MVMVSRVLQLAGASDWNTRLQSPSLCSNLDDNRRRMRMRSPSCHNVDSYSVTFTDMKLFSDIKVTTVIYQRANKFETTSFMVNYNRIDCSLRSTILQCIIT